jgi:hypothetical protein
LHNSKTRRKTDAAAGGVVTPAADGPITAVGGGSSREQVMWPRPNERMQQIGRRGRSEGKECVRVKSGVVKESNQEQHHNGPK